MLTLVQEDYSEVPKKLSGVDSALWFPLLFVTERPPG